MSTSTTASTAVNNAPPPNDPLAGYSLPGVLHYLQVEWRRAERERNEWEIERADLKSRVSILESEKKGLENTKLDLLRRVKMLEFALRQERAKYVQLQQLRTQTSDTIATDSEAQPVQTTTESPITIPQSLQQPSAPGNLLNYTKGSGHVRSKEILKSYLKEVGFLLSSTNAPYSTASGPSSFTNSPNAFRTDSPQEDEERKAVKSDSTHDDSSHESGKPQRVIQVLPRGNVLDGNNVQVVLRPVVVQTASEVESHNSADVSQDQSETINGEGNAKNIVSLTRADDDPNNPWFTSHTVPTVLRQNSKSGGNEYQRVDELGNLILDDSDMDDGNRRVSKSDQLWKARTTLKSHLDSVRALEFHPSQMGLLSGSEDCTAKLWNISSLETKKIVADLEPVFTYRGHSAAVTSVAISETGDICYTASLDSTIRAWKLLPLNTDTYGQYDSSVRLHTFVGHSDIVWDIQLHPLQTQYSLIASASSDGSVKLWNTNPTARSLRSTLWAWGSGTPELLQAQQQSLQNPTSIGWVSTELSQLAVSYQDSKIRIFDIEKGQNITTLPSDETTDGTVSTQINKISCHPTMSMIISAHEDGYIRLFDLNSGKCTHSMKAHADGVSTLDISPSGLSFASGGHDASMRWWDLASKSCVQEYASHRKKFDEGIWSVRYHPSSEVMASAGADSMIRLYQFGDSYE